MWIWLLAVVLLLGTWIGGFYFLNWALWVCILLSVIVVGLVVGWYLFKRWRAVQKAKALEREILKQAEQQAMNARPDRRAEILELQMQVQRGLESLKTSRLGAGRGGSALYTLPWYVIIGPPGAGKTTALKHSGLSFPLEQGKVSGIGGTRNCDWWFTNEAILLDTAGRYATEADDHEEWLSFLGLLKKYRTKKPVNGVIVAISVTDLMEATEEQIDTFSKKLRARIDEVMTRLQMVVPVYVMFTKVDLVAGFVEFWNDLRKSERAHIWGATFPLQGAEQRDSAKAFETEFDILVEAVHARAMRRIGTERQWENRQKIFQFPIEYQALRANLSEFIGGLFAKNNFQETPVFRGVYFSSGTQEGRPIDRVIGGMMRAFNIAPSAGAAPQAAQTESKSYFVTDVFRKVVFPDQFIAGRTKGEVRRQLMNRLAFAAVAMIAAALLLLPALYTFFLNKDLVSRAQAASVKGNSTQWNGTDPVTKKFENLEPLGALLSKEQRWSNAAGEDKWKDYTGQLRGGVGKSFLGWGMYVGDKLYMPGRDVYMRDVKAGFVEPVKKQLETDLDAFAKRGVLDPEQYDANFRRLKAYLEGCDLGYDHTSESNGKTTEGDAELSQLLDVRLSKEPQAKTFTDDDRRSIKNHVELYVEMLTETWKDDDKEDKAGQQILAEYDTKRDAIRSNVKDGATPPLWTCNPAIVVPVRAKLSAFSPEQREYSAIIREANENRDGTSPKITRHDAFGDTRFAGYVSSKDKIPGGKFVQGAYTKAGWENFVRVKLRKDQAKYLTREDWVLGIKDSTKDVKEMERKLDELRRQYFDRFIEEWRAFIADMDVRPPKGEGMAGNLDALQELNALSDIPWPYQRLIELLHKNVTLEDPIAVADQAEAEGLRRLKNEVKANQTVQKIMGDAGAPEAAPKRIVLPPEDAFGPMVKFGTSGPVKEGETPPPTELGRYMQQVVAKVVSVLTELKDSKGRGVDAKTVEATFKEAMTLTTEKIRFTQSGFTEPLLSPLLRNPISLGYAGVLSSLGGAAAGKWESEVWKKWRTVEEKYPFTDSPKDVTLQDYTEFFKPGTGLLWKFYDGNLKGMLDQEGGQFESSTHMGHSVGFTNPFLKCYERGLEITNTTFPPKSETPVVEFSINLHSVSENISEVTFEIDGATRTYKNEPEEWLAVQWPAKEPKSRGGKVRIRGYDGLDEVIERAGEFGFFRLLDAANRIEPGTEGGKRGAPPVIVVTWALRSQPGVVKLDVRPAKSDNVFNWHIARHQRLFRDYRCPRLICKGCEVMRRGK